MAPDPDTLRERLAAATCILFDLDGTLVDTVELIMASARYATEVVLGEALPDDVLKHDIGMPLKDQMERYAPGRSAELLAVYREHNAVVHDDLIREYPGVEEALQALVGTGYRLGVVTSKSRPVAWRGLDRFGLGNYFATLVAYEDTEIHKPRAEPVLEGARRLGVSARSCLYVGDSPHDMAAGIASGAVSVAALWGPFPERVLEPGPDVVLAEIGELAPLLQESRDARGHECSELQESTRWRPPEGL